MTNKVLAGVRDLFFREKISEKARQIGVVVKFGTPRELETLANAEKPSVIILDLEEDPQEYLELVRRLRAEKTGFKPKIVGYLSHVNVALREEAHKAGCHVVFPRSTFPRELPRILKGEFEVDY